MYHFVQLSTHHHLQSAQPCLPVSSTIYFHQGLSLSPLLSPLPLALPLTHSGLCCRAVMYWGTYLFALFTFFAANSLSLSLLALPGASGTRPPRELSAACAQDMSQWAKIMMKSSDTQETHRRSSLYHRSHHKSPPNTWHPLTQGHYPRELSVCVCVCVCEELRSSLELDQHCATLQMLLNPTSHCATKLSALKRRFTCCHWTLRSPDPTSLLALYAAVGSSGPVSDQGFCQRRRSRSLFTDNASKEEAGSLDHVSF